MSDLIRAYLAHCRAGGLTEETLKTKRVVLEMFDRELPMGIERALEEELEEILGGPKQRSAADVPYSVATQKNYAIHLKEFTRYATDPRRPGDGMSYDPAAGLRVPRVPKRRPRPISDEQRHRILTEAAEPYRMWAEVALLTGMRCCELAGVDLDRGDIDEERVLIYSGKGGKVREVPTDPALWRLVRTLPGGMLTRVRDTGAAADARYVSIRSALHFQRTMKIPKMSLHRMRHTFASDLVDAGVDIRIIQELLGHESLTSTQIYTLVKKDQCRTAIQALASHRAHTAK